MLAILMPSIALAAITIPDFVITVVIGAIAVLILYYSLKSSRAASAESKDKILAVISPFAEKNGFKMGDIVMGYPISSSMLKGFEGTYRGRDIKIGCMPAANRVYLMSPNKTNKDIKMPFGDYKKLMAEQGMSDIYKRMEDMKIMDQIWGKYGYPVDINKLTAFFGLTEYAYSASDFKDFVDLLCDLMDRLGM